MDSGGAVGNEQLFQRATTSTSEAAQHAEPSPAPTPHWLVDSAVFQVACFGLVFMNTVTMGFEAEVGNDPAFASLLDVTEHFFTAAFALEMVIKLASLRRSYFRDRWNYLDAFVTMAGVMDVWVLRVALDGSLPDLRSLSVLRVLRLARLVRVMKLMKQFQKIVIIINSVMDAIKTTMWVAILLFGAIYICAIFCVDVIGRGESVASMYPGYAEDESDFDQLEVVSEFNPYLSFGSMGRAMLTLFNIAILAEWTEVVVPISVKQPWLIIFFILFDLFITIGVMSVIIGLIVDNVMANARAMSAEGGEDHNSARLGVLQKIADIFDGLDSDKSGFVTIGEIIESGASGTLAAVMQDAGIGRDITQDEFFGVLDIDGDGKVSANEFSESLYKFLGAGQNRHLSMLMLAVKQMRHQARTTKEECSVRLGRIETILETMMDAAGIPRATHAAQQARQAAPCVLIAGAGTMRPDAQCKSAGLPSDQGVVDDTPIEVTTREDAFKESSASQVSPGQAKGAKQETCLRSPGAVGSHPPAQHAGTSQSTALECLSLTLESMRPVDSGFSRNLDAATDQSMEEVTRIFEAARREAEEVINLKLGETIAKCFKVVKHAVEASGIKVPNADTMNLKQTRVTAAPSAGAASSYPPIYRNPTSVVSPRTRSAL